MKVRQALKRGVAIIKVGGARTKVRQALKRGVATMKVGVTHFSEASIRCQSLTAAKEKCWSINRVLSTTDGSCESAWMLENRLALSRFMNTVSLASAAPNCGCGFQVATSRSNESQSRENRWKKVLNLSSGAVVLEQR